MATRLCALVLAGILGGTALGQAALTPSEIVARLAYASELNMGWGVAECDEVSTFEPQARSAESIEAEVKEFELRNRADIAAGNVPNEWRRMGNDQELLPMDDPRLREIIEMQVHEMVKARRTALTEMAQKTEGKKNIVYYIAQDGRIRLECEHAYFKRGEVVDAQFQNRKETVLLTPSFQKTHFVDRKSGLVQEGTQRSARAAAWDMAAPCPARAGAPTSSICKAENVVFTAMENTTEGRAIKIILRDTWKRPEVGNVHVLWVLPDKGYRLFRRENYIHGRLVQTEENDQYEQIQPGLWFPKHQVTQIVKAELPAEIESALLSGGLDRASEEIFGAQRIIERYRTERLFTRIQWHAEVPEENFDLQFPPGTNVRDCVAGSEAQPLTYVVAEFPEDVTR